MKILILYMKMLVNYLFFTKTNKFILYSNILNNSDDEYNYDDGATSDEDRRWRD